MDSGGDALPEGLPPLGGFAERMGMRLLEAGAERTVGRVAVEPQHRDSTGRLHHGVIATLAETVASVGAFYAVYRRGLLGLGVSNRADYTFEDADGEIEAVAQPTHVGTDDQLWQVQVRRVEDEVLLASVDVRLWHQPLSVGRDPSASVGQPG